MKQELPRSDSSSTLVVMLNKRREKFIHRRRPSLDSFSILTSGTPADAHSLGGPIITRYLQEKKKNNPSALSEKSIITFGSISVDQVEKPLVTNPNFITNTTTTTSSSSNRCDINLGRKGHEPIKMVRTYNSDSNLSRNNNNPARNWNIKTQPLDDHDITPDSEELEERMIGLTKETTLKDYERLGPKIENLLRKDDLIPKVRRYSAPTYFSSTSSEDLTENVSYNNRSDQTLMLQPSMCSLLTSGTEEITEALVENLLGITKKRTLYSSKVIETPSSQMDIEIELETVTPNIMQKTIQLANTKKSKWALTEYREDPLISQMVKRKSPFSGNGSTQQQKLGGSPLLKTPSLKNIYTATKAKITVAEEVPVNQNCAPSNDNAKYIQNVKQKSKKHTVQREEVKPLLNHQEQNTQKSFSSSQFRQISSARLAKTTGGSGGWGWKLAVRIGGGSLGRPITSGWWRLRRLYRRLSSTKTTSDVAHCQ